MTRNIFTFLIAILASACTVAPGQVDIGGLISVKGLDKYQKIIKSGDLITFVESENKTFSITENFNIRGDLSLPPSMTVIDFMDIIYEQKQAGLTPALNSAAEGFTLGINARRTPHKQRIDKSEYVIYVWDHTDSAFTAIIAKKSSDYFLILQGDNISSNVLADIQ